MLIGKLIEECEPPWNFESPSITTADQSQPTPPDDPEGDAVSDQNESKTSQPQFTGKYAALYDYFKHADADTIHLSFDEIENILGASLPASARKYEVWWNSAGHPHAEGWVELGWTAEPNLDDGTVTFDNIS